MLEPGVTGQAGFPGAQLDITLMKVLAARLGTATPVVEGLANLLTPFQHRDSRPFVRLDQAPLLCWAFLLRLIILRQAALRGGTCLRQGGLNSRGAPVNMGLAQGLLQGGRTCVATADEGSHLGACVDIIALQPNQATLPELHSELEGLICIRHRWGQGHEDFLIAIEVRYLVQTSPRPGISQST